MLVVGLKGKVYLTGPCTLSLSYGSPCPNSVIVSGLVETCKLRSSRWPSSWCPFFLLPIFSLRVVVLNNWAVNEEKFASGGGIALFKMCCACYQGTFELPQGRSCEAPSTVHILDSSGNKDVKILK